MTEQWSTQNYPPPKTSRGKKVAAGVVAAVAALMFLGCIGIGVAAISSAAGDPPAVTATPGRAAAPRPTTGKTPTPEPAEKTYGAKDFTPTIKVTDKDCIDFSTIPDSCTYQYEVRLAIADPDAYAAAGDAYSITYAVKGLSGGEQIGTVEVDGDGKFWQFPGFGQAGPKAKLRVRITDVERRS